MFKKDDSYGEGTSKPVETHPLPPITQIKINEAFVNVFFDGTLNNYFNTQTYDKSAKLLSDYYKKNSYEQRWMSAEEEAELERAHQIKERYEQGENSYNNDLTNIARIWKHLKDDKYFDNSAYVEGIGTTRDQEDSQDGFAFGDGQTGVLERAKAAFKKMHEKVFSGNRESEDFPVFLHINVFGFSRGAAAARAFIHLFNTEHYELFGDDKVAKKWHKAQVYVNFVGLFDTVSSYAPNDDKDTEIILSSSSDEEKRGVETDDRDGVLIHGRAHSVFGNDVKQLHLNFKPGYALKVVHLVAADEYRRNFASTTIDSAKLLRVDGKPMGYELKLPGSHSDVGGSYRPRADERRTFQQKALEFVLNQGFYLRNDLIEVLESRSSEPGDIGNKIKQYRYSRTVHGQYHKVALAVMVDKMNGHDCDFKIPESLFAVEPNKPDSERVLEIQNAVREFAKNEHNTEWSLEQFKGESYAKAVRNQCLHLSAVDVADSFSQWAAHDFDTGYARTYIDDNTGEPKA